MTSLRQIEANRRNARLSTGPVTDEGKKRSRWNAVRHGLTAETVIDALEDATDYAAFETAIKADYDPQTAVERELVLRLASLLWRLRRATAIESGLFKNEAQHLRRFRPRGKTQHQSHLAIIDRFDRGAVANGDDPSIGGQETCCDSDVDATSPSTREPADAFDDLTLSFVRLTRLPTYPLDRLNRYEASLWRQTRQVLVALQRLDRCRHWERPRYRSRRPEL
jgi:hypothetical protein